MGLDMYACRTLEQITKSVDFSTQHAELIQQWRKHPNLHGWMESLYRKKGGSGVDFNGNTVLLTLEDLERLEADVLNDDLPCTDGFFFGITDGTEKEEDLMFIENARAAIQEGYQVFYDSWW
ncbi:phosphoglycerate kinase [Pirellulaceae bacterium SH449]